MTSIKESPLKTEVVTKFRFFNHLFWRSKYSSTNTYELLERSFSLALSLNYSGQQKPFFCVGEGKKIATVTKIYQMNIQSVF